MGLISIVYERRDSFDEARRQAGDGYENAVLLKDTPTQPYDVSSNNVVDVPVFFGHAAAALGVVAIRENKRLLKVLDVGGALGGHFGFAKSTFGPNLDFDWIVAETPLYAEHGQKYIISKGLRFVSNMDDIADEAIDIAYYSGVLPYVPSVDTVLDAKAARNAAYIYVSRTGMHDEEINFLQTVTYDTGALRYPGRILKRDAFHARMSREHELVMSWQNDQYSVENRTYTAPSQLWKRK